MTNNRVEAAKTTPRSPIKDHHRFHSLVIPLELAELGIGAERLVQGENVLNVRLALGGVDGRLVHGVVGEVLVNRLLVLVSGGQYSETAAGED